MRTTPIPIIRSDSPQSFRSGHSSSGVFRPLTVAQPAPGQYSLGQTSEFIMMMSEARLQNTEIRMNLQRLSDKMDAMLAKHQTSKQGGVSNEEILAKLDLVLAPLTITILAPEAPVMLGQEVSLQCIVTGARPVPVIQWMGEVTGTRGEVQCKVSV